MKRLIINKYLNFDRASFLRDSKNLNSLNLENKKIKLVEVWEEKFNIKKINDTFVEINWIKGKEAIKLLENSNLTIFIGILDSTYYFAKNNDEHNGEQNKYLDLRRLNPLLKRTDLSILTTIKGLINWHKNNKYCTTCGKPTHDENLGHSRKCSQPTCENRIFPRLDPAVIMLITYKDTCLLGRQKVWPKGMHSTLAGFVEHGETLEQAVARETFEESGVKIKNIEYKYSQPWPFPSSLMLGFRAEAINNKLDRNFSELEIASWLRKDFLKASPENDSFRMPGKVSIARRLIEEWINEN